MIVEQVRKNTLSRREPRKPTSFWASRIGHPCERYLYHGWVDWSDATPPEEGLLEVFAEGKAQERAVELALQNAGFKLVEGQGYLRMEDPPISGQFEGRLKPLAPLDGWPVVDGSGRPVAVPYEIKSISPHSYDKIHSLDDLWGSDRWWERQWLPQLLVYLHILEEPVGVLLLKAKTALRMREFWVDADPAYVEGLIERIRGVHEAVQWQQPPARVEGAWCTGCDHQLTCQPTIVYGGSDSAALDDDPRLVALLNRRDELAPMQKEYAQVDKELKALLGERETVVAGDWIVEGRWVDIPERVMKPTRYIKRTYKRMGGELL